jgi:hypothetical protein
MAGSRSFGVVEVYAMTFGGGRVFAAMYEVAKAG